MPFHTVYVVTRDGFGLSSIGSIIFIAIVALVVFRQRKNEVSGSLALVGLVFIGLIGSLVVMTTVDDYVENSYAYLRGHYSVVEGTVENFHPLPPGKGDFYETFSVRGTRFSYTDFQGGSECFNRSSTFGGPIRQGLYVRIAHRDNCILKLEIANDLLAPPQK